MTQMACIALVLDCNVVLHALQSENDCKKYGPTRDICEHAAHVDVFTASTGNAALGKSQAPAHLQGPYL